MTGFSLKLKSKQGQHVLENLYESTTIADLKAKISKLTKIPEAILNVLVGYPPKPLDLTKECDKISSIPIKGGETLIVDEMKDLKEDAKLAQRIANEENQHMQNIHLRSDNEYVDILLKKPVPADNSCLFTSIGFVINGVINTECGIFMRRIIAEHVAGDFQTYNEGILGRPNLEYCHWIIQPDSWGGAIEVSILSNFYEVEIDVVDITNGIINRFGEDKNYRIRVFLLFDGIHYDPLYMESLTGGPPKTIFPIEDQLVYQQAEQLALEAKSSRQFTDVNKFTLRCVDCECKLVGKTEAQEHAKNTGHFNFGEV